MKRTALSLFMWAALALPAGAQGFDLPSWQHWNLNTMSSDEAARIQTGISNGSITKSEASRLQDRLNKVNDLKNRMSVGGLNMSEKVKLDSELDKLAEQIYRDSNDNDRRGNWLGNKPWDWARNWKGNISSNYHPSLNDLTSWQHWNLNTMTDDEQARINAGLKNGSLTQAEATQLQTRLNQINNLKATLSAGGLSLSERKRIDSELDDLGQQIFRESHDGDRSKWLGNNPYDWAHSWKNQGKGKNWKNDGKYDWKDAKHEWKDDRKDDRHDWNGNNNTRYRDETHGLSNKEVRELSKDYDRYQDKKEKMQETGGGISQREQNKLDRKADKMERKARRDRHD